MNNVNMAGMNMASTGGMPMMNNGAPGRPALGPEGDKRTLLNTYIYDYFIRMEMFDCARALCQADTTIKMIKSEHSGENAEDQSMKEEDNKRPADLPRVDLPRECPESCFLLEWWGLFWDMFNASRSKTGTASNIVQYVKHTQVHNLYAFDHWKLTDSSPNLEPTMNSSRQCSEGLVEEEEALICYRPTTSSR